MGGMGGAQPLAATMNGARFLGIDVDPARIEKRLQSGYCDRIAHSLDEALAAGRSGAKSGGDLGRPGRQLRRCPARDGAARRRPRCSDRPDQRARSAERLRAERHVARRKRSRCGRANPDEYVERSMARDGACTSRRCSRCKRRGAITFDYGNNIRTQAKKAGVENAFDIPGFVPEYIRPLFCEGKGPFRWVALERRSGRHRAHRPAGARTVSRRTKRSRAG